VSRQRVSAAHKKIVELSWHLDYPVRHRETMTIYQVTDRLHDRRTVYMRGNEIAATISAWLAELGVDSPMAEDLADAVRAGDWPSAHCIADYLSVEVTVAA
jgi:hypothetical protein